MKSKAQNVIQGIAKSIIKRQNLELNDILENKKKLTNHECYKPVVDHLIQKCFSLKVLLKKIKLKLVKKFNFRMIMY